MESNHSTVVGNRKDLTGLRVLIVDDNATNRTILQHVTEAWGMKNRVATSGAGALEILRSETGNEGRCELMLLDQHMPGMEGVELARIVHEDPDLTGMRMIMLSSVGQDGGPQEVGRVGISSWLTKPVRQSVLFDCITKAMALSLQEDDTESHASVESGEMLRTAKVRILVAEDNPVTRKSH